MKTLIEFFKGSNTTAKDTLVLYFSGHGILDQDGNCYFGTSNIDPDVPLDNGISLDFFKSLIKSSNANNIVIIFDCVLW